MTRARPRSVSIDTIADTFRSGQRVYLPGSAGEPLALMAALAVRPERSRGLHILSTAIPGINRLDPDALDRSAEVTGLFMQPGLRQAQREGRFKQLPLSFAGFVDHVRDRVTTDICAVHVAPPKPPAAARWAPRLSSRRWSRPGAPAPSP